MSKAAVAVTLLSVTLLTALSGCAAQLSATPSASPTVSWSAELAAFTDKYGSKPASDPPYTEDQAHAATAQQADQQWGFLLKQYPDAVRPTPSFVHWATAEDADKAACFVAAGAIPETGSSADGTTSVGYSGPATVDYAVATFDCEMVRYPVRQSPWPNAAQIGYYYDYLTQYLVPCYRAHSAAIDPGMPTRAQYIAQYGRDHVGSRWQLTPPNAADAADPAYDGASAVCSAIGPGGAQP